MRILLLSFYYPPDLCAGSFRAGSLVRALMAAKKPADCIDVITTMPNRYATFSAHASREERQPGIRILRAPLPRHRSGFLDQSRAFAHFAAFALRHIRPPYDIVVATSSRLMTAFLGAVCARRSSTPLYLDVRDLFTDVMTGLLPRAVACTVLPLLRRMESFAFRQAAHINVVSEAFVPHVKAIAPQAEVTVHPNGIDEDFLGMDYSKRNTKRSKVCICYAGNIGQGQGLEKIIPPLAAVLGDGYSFRIIGDGGMRQRLQEDLKTANIANVEMRPPVTRASLIKHYRNADILFLHLNDVPAFSKVLPSKIFEYAATGKPILAGVRGYARAFLQREVPGSYCFDPGDAEAAATLVREIPLGPVDRSGFIRRYSRTNIMRTMAEEILHLPLQNGH